MALSNHYGFCPVCGGLGKMRERRPNGNDTCENGHTYPSKDAKVPPGAERKIRIEKENYNIIVSHPDQTKSFAISWTTDQMKERHFQVWLDEKIRDEKKKMPAGFVCFDEHMNKTSNDLVMKTWRYARQDFISIEAK